MTNASNWICRHAADVSEWNLRMWERTCHSKTAFSVGVLTSYLKAVRGIIRHTLSCTACSLRNAVDQRGGWVDSQLPSFQQQHCVFRERDILDLWMRGEAAKRSLTLLHLASGIYSLSTDVSYLSAAPLPCPPRRKQPTGRPGHVSLFPGVNSPGCLPVRTRSADSLCRRCVF